MSEALTIYSPVIATYITKMAIERAVGYIGFTRYPTVEDFTELFDGDYECDLLRDIVDDLTNLGVDMSDDNLDVPAVSEIALEILDQGRKVVAEKEYDVRFSVVFVITSQMEEQIASTADISDTEEDIAERISWHSYALEIKSDFTKSGFTKSGFVSGSGDYPASWVEQAWNEVSPSVIAALIEDRVAA